MAFKILSFCGGGIRGLASVAMLNVLQQKTGNANIAQDADMLAGTSTGSSIVAALARKKDRAPETAAELINFFRTSELKFFKNQNYLVSKPGYDVKDIAADMELKYLGIKLKDLPQRVLMTAFNVGDAAKKIDWQPVLFHNFPFSTVSETPLADAVVSSGAMPGMLGSHKGNVDGAFVHHDPTLAAISLAVRGGHKLADIVVICFGTGFMGNSLGRETANWGGVPMATRHSRRPQSGLLSSSAFAGEWEHLSHSEYLPQWHLHEPGSGFVRDDACRSSTRILFPVCLFKPEAQRVHSRERAQLGCPRLSSRSSGAHR
jgi:patatin-like phospholipase/acyl hydrolase